MEPQSGKPDQIQYRVHDITLEVEVDECSAIRRSYVTMNTGQFLNEQFLLALHLQR